MEIPIKISKPNYYSTYIEILNPILKLKKREKELLVEYAKLYHNNVTYNEEQLRGMFSDTSIKWDIRRTLNMSEPSFNNHIKQLRDKKIFIDGLLHPLITSGLVKTGNIDLNYKILVTDEQTNKETNRESSREAQYTQSES